MFFSLLLCFLGLQGKPKQTETLEALTNKGTLFFRASRISVCLGFGARVQAEQDALGHSVFQAVSGL